MRRFQRTAKPACLDGREEEWGVAWERRRAAGGTFHWPKIGNRPLNQHLLPDLKRQTQDHCSFCDNYPVSPPSIDTIEHFRPKSRFPREAFVWENLYYCCTYCQAKGDNFDESALQPDAEDFEFDRYFRWDFTRGELLVNERASEADRRRARTTIDLYRLNVGHPLLRKQWRRWRSKLADEPLDHFAYRGFVGDPAP